MVEMDKQFDLFTSETSMSVEEQREFEIWWKRQTGRAAILVAGVQFVDTLEYK